jgi:hypothetical protein
VSWRQSKHGAACSDTHITQPASGPSVCHAPASAGAPPCSSTLPPNSGLHALMYTCAACVQQVQGSKGQRADMHMGGVRMEVRTCTVYTVSRARQEKHQCVVVGFKALKHWRHVFTPASLCCCPCPVAASMPPLYVVSGWCTPAPTAACNPNPLSIWHGCPWPAAKLPQRLTTILTLSRRCLFSEILLAI